MSKEIKKKKKSKGFTLIEILVAVLIVGILASIALPTYQKTVEKGRVASPLSNLGAIARAQKTKKLESLHYTDKVEELDISLPDEATGEKATGSTFEGKDFTYTVYGDDEEAAIAKRKNVDEDKEYTLSVDYATGELFCSPEGHPICLELGLGVGRNLDPTRAYDWHPCQGEYDRAYPNTTIKENSLTSCQTKTDENGNTYLSYCRPGYCGYGELDSQGRETKVRSCSSFDGQGNCLEYDSQNAQDFIYGDNFRAQLFCKTFEQDGVTCAEYSERMDTTYDENGRTIEQAFCTSFKADDNTACAYYEDKNETAYNLDGQVLYNRRCNAFKSDGVTCDTYTDEIYNNYDANGNRTSYMSCMDWGGGRDCLVDTKTYYNNDTHKPLVDAFCDGGNVDYNNKTCSQYNEYKEYYYNDNGEQIGYLNCSIWQTTNGRYQCYDTRTNEWCYANAQVNGCAE